MKEYRFDGQTRLNIAAQPTGAGEHKKEKAELKQKTEENMNKAAILQEKLFASGQEALVIAIQARDAAGKDGLIKHVFNHLNPAALEVHAFKAPTKTELAHDYLWRLNQALPPRGKIAVFNRSQYEDVLAVRVHHLQDSYVLAPRCIDDKLFERRFRQLRDWEEYLWENGIRMVKLFLNVSKETQRERFLDRIERDDKHWKLSTDDMNERALWAEYDTAFEDAINGTATPHSPWYVLPADDKWYTRYLVSQLLVDTLEDMNPQYPPLPESEVAKIPAMLEKLG